MVHTENWKLLCRADIKEGIRYHRTEDLCYLEPQDTIILRFMISQIECITHHGMAHFRQVRDWGVLGTVAALTTCMS